mgnify:CR=1 FL=1
MNWCDTKLGEVLIFKNGKKRPSENGEIPVYGGNGILGFSNQANNENCIVIGRVGAYCGSVYYEHGKCWVSDNAICAIPKDENDISFLYYLLKHLELNKKHIGTSQPLLTQEILNSIMCKVPERDQQLKIGRVLCCIDEKIECNKRINDNLQQQASAIYQAWFEEFLLSGGSCPSTWKHGILADIANITSGKRPSVKFFEMTENAVIPIVGAASIMGYTSESNHTDKILVTGGVGTHGVIQRFSSPCWTSDNTLVITSDLYEYTYQLLKRIDYHSMNRGSTQPLITQSDMNKVPILIPDSETLNNFELLAGKLMEQYQSNLLESRKLAELRDTLLPKLISGEIDVSNLQL